MSNRLLIVVTTLLTLSLLAICDLSIASAGNRRDRTTTSSSPVTEDPESTISNISCDAVTPCPEGMECWTLMGSGTEGPMCVTPNPAKWYCKDGTKPVVSESEPPMLSCQPKK